MSLLSEILKEAPLSAVLQERIKALEADKAKLCGAIDDCGKRYEVLNDKHQKLAASLEEDVVFHEGVEFRRGRKTGGKWLPFCPGCGGLMRALDPKFGVVCSKCKVHSPFASSELDRIIATIPSAN